jgi:hypothetical protein
MSDLLPPLWGELSFKLTIMIPIGAIISAVGSIASSALSNSANSANSSTAFRRQKELANLQFSQNSALQSQANDFTMAMWNKQNAYNSPVESRARLEAAGYNPFLQGPMSPGMAQGVSSAQASVGQGSAPQTAPSTFGSDVVHALTAAAANALQEKQTDADVKNKNADTDGKNLDNVVKTAEATVAAQKAQASLRGMQNSADLTQRQKESVEQSIDYLDAIMPTRIEQASANLKQTQTATSNIEANTAKTKQETDNLKTQGQMLANELHIQPKQLAADLAKTWSEVTKNRSDANLSNAEVGQVVEQMKYTYQLKTGQSISNSTARKIQNFVVAIQRNLAQHGGLENQGLGQINDWRPIMNVMEILKDAASVGGSVATAVK